uniref:Uncharacterized protein n=2 Tax=Ixodes scapularis TaxID=6945 RepID=A0A1S4LUL3_IXOSC
SRRPCPSPPKPNRFHMTGQISSYPCLQNDSPDQRPTVPATAAANPRTHTHAPVTSGPPQRASEHKHTHTHTRRPQSRKASKEAAPAP